MSDKTLDLKDMQRVAAILERQRVYVAVWKASQDIVDGWPRWKVTIRKVNISEIMRGEGIGL